MLVSELEIGVEDAALFERLSSIERTQGVFDQ